MFKSIGNVSDHLRFYLNMYFSFLDDQCCRLPATWWKTACTDARSWTLASTLHCGAMVSPTVPQGSMRQQNTALSFCSYPCFTSRLELQESSSSAAPSASSAVVLADADVARNCTGALRAFLMLPRSAKKSSADTATILCATWRSIEWPLCDFTPHIWSHETSQHSRP